MTDKPVAEEKVVETETTQADSPPVKEEVTAPETVAEVSDDQGTATKDTDELPEDSVEQRRAFQEQRLEIKRLKEEKGARSKGESAFNAFRQQTPPGQIRPVNIQDFTDPITGETNLAEYNQAVNDTLEQTRQMASYQANTTAQELIDENNARTKHPDVMNNKDLEQEVADRWLAAKMRGENPLVSDIAARVAKRESKTVSKAEKIGAEKILNEVSEKEQAGLNAEGQTSAPGKRASSQEELESLRVKTRHSDDDAITARVSQIPWVNK